MSSPSLEQRVAYLESIVLPLHMQNLKIKEMNEEGPPDHAQNPPHPEPKVEE